MYNEIIISNTTKNNELENEIRKMKNYLNKFNKYGLLKLDYIKNTIIHNIKN